MIRAYHELASVMTRSNPAGEQADPLLALFLSSTDDSQAEVQLARLVSDHAEPVIRDILRQKLRGGSLGANSRQDAEDLHGDVLVRIVSQLRVLKINPDVSPIRDLRSYTAVATYHAFHEYLRDKHPQRSRLKNRLRYFLTHQPGFGLWVTRDGQWLAGFADWQKGEEERSSAVPSTELFEGFQAMVSAAASQPKLDRLSLGDVLGAVFRWVGGPIELDQLVSVVADLHGIKDRSSSRLDDAATASERVPASEAGLTQTLEQRSYLERLWGEVGQLPLRQRAALLLNLRDVTGGDALALFPLTGVASIRQIAAVLDMRADEFASLWNNLPLEDAVIAERLGITRQQVINLRKSARERLTRRMKRSGRET
jgi:DNA-directed RNA polymerase specialized sigma24 family protein